MVVVVMVVMSMEMMCMVMMRMAVIGSRILDGVPDAVQNLEGCIAQGI